MPHFEQYVSLRALVGSLKSASKRDGRLAYSVLQDGKHGLGALARTL